MYRICVVEDSEILQSTLKSALQNWYEIEVAGNLKDAFELILKGPCDLILLDVNLPDGNGLEFCAKLKNHLSTKDIPVIFLTAKSEPIDKMMGFSMGADDYLTKPFELIEMKARIEARIQSRRFQKKQNDGPLVFGKLKFDRLKQRVFSTENEQDLRLTSFEYKILYFLATNEGQVYSRADLLKNVNDDNTHVNDENIYTHVSALRKKLGTFASYLECVPRVGYRFVTDRKQAA